MDVVNIKETVESLVKTILADDFALYEGAPNYALADAENSVATESLSSLQLVSLIVAIEEEFHISIPDECLLTLKTIDDLVSQVNILLNDTVSLPKETQ